MLNLKTAQQKQVSAFVKPLFFENSKVVLQIYLISFERSILLI